MANRDQDETFGGAKNQMSDLSLARRLSLGARAAPKAALGRQREIPLAAPLSLGSALGIILGSAGSELVGRRASSWADEDEQEGLPALVEGKRGSINH